MKRATLFIVLTLLISNTYSQWVQTGGPYGAFVTDVIVNGATTYLSTKESGIYKSLDNGLTWVNIKPHVPGVQINCLATSGTLIFAGTNSKGVWVSMDNGMTWNTANNGLSISSITSIAYGDSKLFVGAGGSNLFMSSNNGASWTLINNGFPPSQTINTILVKGSNYFVGTGSSGVYLSTNGGVNWNQINNGIANGNTELVYQLITDGSTVYAGCFHNFYKTTDNGTTWVGLNYTFNTSERILVDGSNLYTYCSGGGVSKSSNNGTSWNRINDSPSNYAYALTKSGNNIIAAGSSGVYLQPNTSSSFIRSNNGLIGTTVRTFSKMGSTLIVGSDNGHGVFNLAGNGILWNSIVHEAWYIGVNTLANDGTQIILGSNGYGIFKTTDNGTNWTGISTGLTNNYIYSIAFGNNIVYAGTGGKGVFKSTNNGTNWIAANNGIDSRFINTLLMNGTTLLAGTSNDGIYSSNNEGASWNQISLTGKNIRTIKQNNNKIYASISGDGVWYSLDNGNSWNQINNGLTDWNVYSITFDGNNNIYVATASGVFVSKDNGANWIKINLGLPQVPIYSVEVFGNYVYAGANGLGVWRRPLTDFSTVVPAVPVTTTATAITKNSFTAVWNSASNAAGYYLDVATNSSFTSFLPGFNSKDVGNVFTYSVTGLNTNTPYFYRVRAYNQGDISSNSNVQTLTTLSEPPAVPQLIANNIITQTSFKAAWNVVNDVTKYYLDVSTNQNFTAFVGDYNSKDIGNVTSFLVYGLQPNTDYWFRTRSGNSSGTSPNSNILSIKTKQNTQWIQTSGPSKTVGGPANTGVRYFIKVDNTIYGAAYSATGLFKTTDNGTTWLKVFDCANDVVNLLADGNNIYATTNGSGVYISEDKGVTWNQKNSGLANLKVYSITKSGSYLYAAIDGEGVFLSINNGASWSATNTGLTQKNINTVLALGETVFAGSNSAGVFISTNFGVDWRQTTLTGKNIIILKTINNKIYAATWGSGVYVSNDNGTTWNQSNTGLGTNLNCLIFSIHTANDLFTTTGDGIYYSKNAGATWTNITANFPAVTVWTVEAFGNYLFAGTSELGVFRRTLSEIVTDIDVSSELPSEFKLYQNYPNPFNPSTTINYQLPTAEHVTLKVYDVLGNEVATLVNEYKQAGKYEVKFGTSHFERSRELTSGIYFYRLSAGNSRSTKKLILIK